MRVIDIKSDMPIVQEAIARLKYEIIGCKKTEKIVKVLHGYGSTGVGGGIKKATHHELKRLKTSKMIKDFIPGEGFDLLSGYSSVIAKYKELLKSDSDYGRSNDGITYVILK